MGLIRWMTKNWANTEEPTHADLAPLEVPRPLAETLEIVRKAIATMSRWHIVESSPEGILKLTRRTGIMRFVDDVVVTLHSAGAATIVHARSNSRIGKGDLGQNRRNILELWKAIRALI